ncbi:hypothetical protein B0H16DRAFT_1887451 [Mycena metata]|uniref:Uncharacterized protein n=1 Tax=Mycena metata TaxID=1033252 RepID=A0AAD7NAI6_9AGAR|nr:hypothetical protein B0H16DRAFT_1887451 [Mycena metata]
MLSRRRVRQNSGSEDDWRGVRDRRRWYKRRPSPEFETKTAIRDSADRYYCLGLNIALDLVSTTQKNPRDLFNPAACHKTSGQRSPRREGGAAGWPWPSCSCRSC